MNRTLFFTPAAERDVAEARQWHEERATGRGQQFEDAVDAALRFALRFPEGAREVAPGVRRRPVRRFSYGIYYRVEPNRLAILAVYHASRDPRGWRERL